MQKGHLYCLAPSLTGSICKISRQKKLKKINQILFYFINISIPWTFLTCEYKLPEWEKVFKQWSHENGFSPVCILICLFIFALDPKMILTQKGHLYFPAPSLIGSICKISRRKKVEKKNSLFFYQYLGIPWTFLICDWQLLEVAKVLGQ